MHRQEGNKTCHTRGEYKVQNGFSVRWEVFMNTVMNLWDSKVQVIR